MCKETEKEKGRERGVEREERIFTVERSERKIIDRPYDEKLNIARSVLERESSRVAKFSLIRRSWSRNECEYMQSGTREIDCLRERVCEKRDRRKQSPFAGGKLILDATWRELEGRNALRKSASH